MSTEPGMRLKSGGLIDRQAVLDFSFDGRWYQGYAGDTLASALLANGVRLMGRSFKYHRPRGTLTAGSEEPNALVELREGARREPNTRATVTELFEGLSARSQNRFPTLRWDLMAINDLFSPLLTAGFYYKTFMWPASFWEKVYEPIIRRAAGLGALSGLEDPDSYEKAYAHCDVLVIGAGPAGLCAALGAARAGARVVLADEDFRMGGRLLAETHSVDGRPGHEWVSGVIAELRSMPEVRLLTRTTVQALFDHGVYAALEKVCDHLSSPPGDMPRQRLWRIHARQAVLAAGALERPVVFPGNDRPGVMLAGAVRTYINRYATLAGERTAVFTNNDDGWRTAADLVEAGAEVSAVIDARPADALPPVSSRLGNVPVISAGRVTGTRGRLGLRSLNVVDGNGRRHRFDTEVLAVSGGWNPALNLTCHQGGKPAWSEPIAAFLPGEKLPTGLRVAGAAGGSFSTAAALHEGHAAGLAAAGDCGFDHAGQVVPEAEDEPYRITPLWRVDEGRGRAWVDYQNDVTSKDLKQAHAEGFRSVEHLKRYTTLGMATDQGKTGNVPALALMAELTGKTIAHTGTTVFRPPYTPVAIGALAGRSRGKSFRPVRLTPSHHWAVEQGAAFVEAGNWLRAQWFPRDGETTWRESVDREVLATRQGVGICDVTTLGKIDIQGADAGAFLNFVYANGFAKLPVGKCRYGLMLRDDGLVKDDGTTARLADDHYLMTTTTANAVSVFRHLEFCRQCLRPELDVQIISVTEQWAQFAVAGPDSRRLLQKVLDSDCDISDPAFPYMACTAVTVCGGVPGRVFRLSFSGELAFEIAVPARFGDSLIRVLMQAGEEFGATPYGTEALGVMRIEKGHPAGNELNGQSTARDLGMSGMLSKPADYIGRVGSRREGLNRPDGLTLMGFKPVDEGRQLFAGAHFLALGAEAITANDEGYMTSVAHSPTLGHAIGLGYISRGSERLGEQVRAVELLRGEDTVVEICTPHFVDPEGARVRG